MAIEGSSSEYTRVDQREISKREKNEGSRGDERLQTPALENNLKERKNLESGQDKLELSSPAPKNTEEKPNNNAVYERAEAAREQAKQKFQQQAQREIEQKRLEAGKADQQKQQNAEVDIKKEAETRQQKEALRKEENRELERNQNAGPVKRPDDDPLRNLNLLA